MTLSSILWVLKRTDQGDSWQTYADPESFVRGGPHLITFFCLFFLVDEGIEDLNTAINGPSLAHKRNTIEMAFRWRADDGQTLNAGLVALWFFRGPAETLYFCDFSGVGGGGLDPLSPPPLNPHMTDMFELDKKANYKKNLATFCLCRAMNILVQLLKQVHDLMCVLTT